MIWESSMTSHQHAWKHIYVIIRSTQLDESSLNLLRLHITYTMEASFNLTFFWIWVLNYLPPPPPPGLITKILLSLPLTTMVLLNSKVFFFFFLVPIGNNKQSLYITGRQEVKSFGCLRLWGFGLLPRKISRLICMQQGEHRICGLLYTRFSLFAFLATQHIKPRQLHFAFYFVTNS